MQCIMLKSKLHNARVTEAVLDYEGSLTLDALLMQAAGLLPNEKILVANMENGNRFETYVIAGPAGSGTVCLNGAAARLGGIGDRLIILAFCILAEDEAQRHLPRTVRLDEHNQPEQPSRQPAPANQP